MRNKSFIIALLCLTVALASCSKDEDTTYPNLITDFVMVFSDSNGKATTMLTDTGQRLTIDNNVSGVPKDTCVRAMCGYEPTTDGHAHIYTINGVPVLVRLKKDMELRRSPTGVAAVWYSGGYINLHLTPKTRGGLQNWAVAADSTNANAAGGTNYYLILYHDQASDVEAYTGHLYASISPDSIAADIQPADSFHLDITTYSGIQSWHFRAK